MSTHAVVDHRKPADWTATPGSSLSANTNEAHRREADLTNRIGN
jgi:hypothetical protein